MNDHDPSLPGIDPAPTPLSVRLDALADAGASPLAPPSAFLAAVGRRRRARRSGRLALGFVVAAALVLAGLAWRSAAPNRSPAPRLADPRGPTDRPTPNLTDRSELNDQLISARIAALRAPGEPVDAHSGDAGTSARGTASIRAADTAVYLRDTPPPATR